MSAIARLVFHRSPEIRSKVSGSNCRWLRQGRAGSASPARWTHVDWTDFSQRPQPEHSCVKRLQSTSADCAEPAESPDFRGLGGCAVSVSDVAADLATTRDG